VRLMCVSLLCSPQQKWFGRCLQVW